MKLMEHLRIKEIQKYNKLIVFNNVLSELSQAVLTAVRTCDVAWYTEPHQVLVSCLEWFPLIRP